MADDVVGGFGTGTVTFAPGESTATVDVPPVADSTPEADETVLLTLTGATGGTLGATTSAIAAIVDDDTTPTVTISRAVDAFEGVSPSAGPLTFYLTRSGDLSRATTVDYVLGGSTATADDVLGGFGPGSVIFAPNQDTAIVVVYPLADTVPEPDETVRLTLTGVLGGTLGSATSATATILNDDFLPVVAIDTAYITTEGQPGGVDPGPLTFLVVRTGDLSNTTTVSYTLGGGTATADDLVGGFGSGSVVFSPGQITAIVTARQVADLVLSGARRLSGFRSA